MTELLSIEIGKKIKELRLKANLTQEKLAGKLLTSESTVTRMEKGETNAWVHHINELCNIFNYKFEDFIKFENSLLKNVGINNASYNLSSEKILELYETVVLNNKEEIARLKAEIIDKNAKIESLLQSKNQFIIPLNKSETNEKK